MIFLFEKQVIFLEIFFCFLCENEDQGQGFRAMEKNSSCICSFIHDLRQENW